MKNYLLHIIFILIFSTVNAQDSIRNINIDDVIIEQKSFDENALKTYKNQDEFNYNVVKKEPNFVQRVWTWLGRKVKKFLGWLFDDIAPAVGILKTILEIIPYLILGLALYFILKFFLKMNTSSGELSEGKINGVFTSDEEELIKNKDLEALIKNAIETNNYRLAIRYYYLFILSKLSEKEFIIWQQEKTNEDYISELSNESLIVDFKKSTKLYDFVWYGGFEVNETEFQKAERLFLSLKNKING